VADARREDATRRVSNRRRALHWEAARRKFHLDGDEVHDDDAATHFAEERMCVEALGSWQKRGSPQWTLVQMKCR
jgi:hypothetical protein